MEATEMWNLYFAPDQDDWQREPTAECEIQTTVGVYYSLHTQSFDFARAEGRGRHVNICSGFIWS
jgi:hypothetical protein